MPPFSPGVDRYGRPSNQPQAQQANPYHDQQNNNPAYQAPAHPQGQYSNAMQGAQAPQQHNPFHQGLGSIGGYMGGLHQQAGGGYSYAQGGGGQQPQPPVGAPPPQQYQPQTYTQNQQPQPPAGPQMQRSADQLPPQNPPHPVFGNTGWNPTAVPTPGPGRPAGMGQNTGIFGPPKPQAPQQPPPMQTGVYNSGGGQQPMPAQVYNSGGQQPATNPNFNYQGARDSWMSGKYSKDEAGATQWANDYGIQYGGGDTINLPNGGGSIDILGNWAGGKGNGQAVTQNWTPAGGNGPNPGGQGGGGATGFANYGPPPMTPAQMAGVPGFGVSNGHFTYGGVAMPGSYQPGQLPNTPLQTYNPQQFSQYNAPDQADPFNQQQDVLSHLLQSGGSLGPGALGAMKAAQSEEANAGYNSAMQAAQQNAAARGLGGGGNLDVAQRRLSDSRNSQITQGNRGLDVSAAQTNYNDTLNALGLGNTQLNSQAQRAQENFKTGLSGQVAQSQENQTGVNSQNNAIQFALNNALSQEGLNRQGTQDAFAQWLAASQLGEGGRQADLSAFLQNMGMNNQNQQYYAGLGQNQNQFNSNMNFNWANAANQNQNQLLQYLLGNGAGY